MVGAGTDTSSHGSYDEFADGLVGVVNPLRNCLFCKEVRYIRIPFPRPGKKAVRRADRFFVRLRCFDASLPLFLRDLTLTQEQDAEPGVANVRHREGRIARKRLLTRCTIAASGSGIPPDGTLALKQARCDAAALVSAAAAELTPSSVQFGFGRLALRPGAYLKCWCHGPCGPDSAVPAGALRVLCAPGDYMAAGQCLPCTVGYYCPGGETPKVMGSVGLFWLVYCIALCS